ncbi:MAG: hypothetical protein ABW278_15625 [Steroidobacteraceae bacterium]
MSEILDRLQMAALRLSQDGPLKDRLADAYASYLLGLDVHDLPAELRAEMDQLNAAMHREIPQPRESVIRASVRKMSSQEVGQLAGMVVLMFTSVVRAELAHAPVPRPARVPSSAPVVQLFAEA